MCHCDCVGAREDAHPPCFHSAALDMAEMCVVLQVPDCEHPDYFVRMDRLVELNKKLVAIQGSAAPEFVKKIDIDALPQSYRTGKDTVPLKRSL